MTGYELKPSSASPTAAWSQCSTARPEPHRSAPGGPLWLQAAADHHFRQLGKFMWCPTCGSREDHSYRINFNKASRLALVAAGVGAIVGLVAGLLAGLVVWREAK